jgi:Transposase, Mutator family
LQEDRRQELQNGDCAGSCRKAQISKREPQFIRKGQKRFGGFDTKIIAMYAQGMTVREMKRFLEEQYKVEVSSDLISTVTDSVMEDVIEWQNRPVEPMYAVVFSVVFFEALRVRIRDEGTVKNKRSILNRRSQRSQRVTVFKSHRRHVGLHCLNLGAPF